MRNYVIVELKRNILIFSNKYIFSAFVDDDDCISFQAIRPEEVAYFDNFLCHISLSKLESIELYIFFG